MPIEIRVVDPANTPRADLALVISVLQRFHDAHGERIAGAAPTLPPGLAPADNPEAGVDVQAPAAFGGNPVEAFGNTSGSFVPYLEQPGSPNFDGAAAFEAHQNALDPNAAFGAAGNVPPAAGNPGTIDPGIASLPPVAPSAPQPTGAPAPAGVELDKDGLPWDGRIHAGTKGKNADGRWKAKRGVEAGLVEQVQAELRALMALPGARPPAPPAPPAAGNVAVSPGLPPAPPAPPAAPITAPGAAAIIPTASTGAPSFVSVMTRVGELVASGKLTEAEANSAVQSVGLLNYPQLVSRPDLVPTVSTFLDQLVAAKG